MVGTDCVNSVNVDAIVILQIVKVLNQIKCQWFYLIQIEDKKSCLEMKDNV